MKQQMTYGQLIAIDADIISVKQKPGLAFLLQTSIKRFDEANAQRVNLAKKTINTMLAKHIEVDGAGKLRQIDKADGSKEYIWKTPGSFAAYNKECEEFLNRTIDVFL